MVARNFCIQEIPYSRLLQVSDDDQDFITLEELKPVIDQQNTSMQQYSQSSYYELSSASDNPCSSSTLFQDNVNSKHAMELQSSVDGSVSSTNRKRKMSYHDTSDLEDDNNEDVKSVRTSDENKKQNHSEIEKRRRDKMNTYITELSAIIPMCHAMSRKLDKLTVLRMAVQHLKTIRGAVNSYTEGHYKPAFLSDQELKHLILQATDGFLFVIGCDRGRILYVSESVSKILNYSQGDLLGHSLFDILHPKDVAKAKEQLSSSDLNPRERLIDAKTMLPVKAEVPHGGSKLCPGARRSFFCRMKCKVPSQIKEEADTTTGCHKRKKQQSSGRQKLFSVIGINSVTYYYLFLDKKYSLIHCSGYLKSWTPAKIGLEDQENDGENESCNLSCLVAVGRILPHISIVAAATQSKPFVHPIQFISRHTLDGKFIFVDQRATLVLGFLQQELLGSSMYEYYHHDDIASVAECHKCALQNPDETTTKIYRFRTKDGGFVKLKSEWKSFKNPWTKDVEYLLAKNTLLLTDFRTVESSACKGDGVQENLELYSRFGKDIQKIINTHVEASKIGKQIAEQVMDAQRRTDFRSGSSSGSDPDSPLPISSTENNISTSASVQPESTSMMHEFPQTSRSFNHISTNVSLPCTTNEQVSGGNADGEIIEIMEDAVRGSPNNEPVTEGNDEAAMAVIMSLLEADAGLGGPVDFSGLPWPLP